MKNYTKAMLLLIISSIFVGSVSASTIDKIEALNNNSIELTASSDITFSDIDVKGEVKILKDIPVSFSVKDAENVKKILINLGSDLTANTSYSIISILGANGNIDFSISDFIQGEIKNINLLSGEEGIEKVNIIDSRTIELYFTNDLIEDVFEFKILSDVEIIGLKSEGNNKIQLEIPKALKKSTNYIIMILSLEDINGKSIKLDEDLYDFITPKLLEQAIPEEETVVAEVFTEPEVLDEGNIPEVALESADVPETGTTTSILILFTIIVNSVFFFRKKIFS